MLGLYLHIPFCAAICNYCNFNRGLLNEALKTAYVDALVAEIAAAAERATAVDTIYFGGGTPSLLSAPEVARILDACRRSFAVEARAEITLEANPETSSVAMLTECRAAGVNRLSFGVQSLRDEELQRLGRLHNAARARRAVDEARSAGFDNISLDLMMWLPGQRVSEWLDSVDGIVALAPEHISFYLLELYPNAPLKDEMARAGWSLAPDDDAAEMYLEGLRRFDAAGYEQYEISNTAHPGCHARHNSKYWQDGEWLGFGCGAHSTRGGVRWRNVAATIDYVERVRRRDSVAEAPRRLSSAARVEEALFTALRLTTGIDEQAVATRYGVDVWARYGGELQRCVDGGVLVRDAGYIRLTRAGMLLANEVMAIFVEPGSTLQ